MATLQLRGVNGQVDASLAPALAELCARYGVPFGVAAGWILAESNGKVTSGGLASLDERGYFQISKEESAKCGIDDHARLSTDPLYSLEGGLQLVNYYRGVILSLTDSVADGSEYLYRLCKFFHGAGAGAGKKLLTDAADSGVADWAGFETNERGAQIPGHSTAYVSTWMDQTDKVFNLGAAYGPLSDDGEGTTGGGWSVGKVLAVVAVVLVAGGLVYTIATHQGATA